MVSLRQMASKLSPKGWAMVGGSAAAAILFLFLIFQMASQPSYSTLMTGLDPAQTGKITSTLDTKGIGYQLQNGGTALAVQSDKTSEARVALAGAGLLTSQQPGFSLFDKQQLGESNFQQQITYQRALQGQLAQTIESIQGISGAQVQLVIPNSQDQLFSDTAQQASAAVLLSGTTSLDSGAVKGIAQLVSSAVPGLQLGKVTITDASGNLLWPTGDASSNGSGVSKQSAEARYDATTAAQVNAMLTQTLGPGKSQVEVNADLNTNQTSSDSLTYANKGVPLQQHKQTESLTGGSSKAGGVAGSAGNIPSYAQTGGSGSSNYKNTVTDTTFGVNKTVTHAVISPGAVNRQSVSVLVDKSVPAASIPALGSAVASAVGLNTKRGDMLSIGQVAFVKTTTPTATPSPMAKYGKYAVYALVGLASILFLFFVTRHLRKREREEFVGNPTWVRELTAPRPLAALEAGQDDAPTQVAKLRSPVNVAKQQIEELVQRDPDRVAQQVRAWMSED